MKTQKSKNGNNKISEIILERIKNVFQKSALIIPILVLSLSSTVVTAQKKASTVKPGNDLYEFYRDYIAAANSRDFDAIADIVAERVKLNGNIVKREDIIKEFKKLIEAVPDFTWDIQDLLVDGNSISARLTDTGTPSENTFFGPNPERKLVEFTEYGSYKVENGYFVEMWYLIDFPSIARQLEQ
jgi:predicted ester cyclase